MKRRYATRPLSIIVSAAALIVLVLPSGALALPFSVGLHVQADFGESLKPPVEFDLETGPLQQSQVSFNFPATSVIGALGSARGAMNVEARLGHLTGSLDLAANGGGEIAPGVVIVFGGGLFGQAQWTDTFTVISSSLPLGTPVQLLAHVQLDSTLDLRTGKSAAETNFLVGAQAFWIIGPGPLVDLEHMVEVASGPAVLSRSQAETLSFLTAVGDSFTVTGVLSMSTASLTDGPFEVSRRIITVPHSATFFLDSEDPNASYITASGVNYESTESPAPVPAPATLLLLGTMAAGLGVVRWRQRGGK
jgi:hypothetical protein